MATIDVIGPPGLSLTLSLFPLGSDTAVHTGLALTERTNLKGHYRRDVTGLTGWHVAQLRGTGNALEAEWHVLMKNDSSVCYGQDLDHAVMARIEAQVTTGPVVVIPTPTDQGVTVAWTICRDANGLPVAGALIEVAAWGPIQPGHGSFASQSVVATSNGTGMARVDIPREANLKFRVRRGKVVSGVQQWGNWSEFVGVDADRLELPLTIG